MDIEEILASLKPGTTLKLSIKGSELLVAEAEEGRIEVRLFNIDGIKSLIPHSKGKGDVRGLADFAKRLEGKGFTLDVFNSDKLVLRLGKGAKPGLLTFFGPVQVSDIKTLVKLMG